LFVSFLYPCFVPLCFHSVLVFLIQGPKTAVSLHR